MDRDPVPKIIPSTGKVEKQAGKARSALGPNCRFIFEGELLNPEKKTRNALITAKDLQNRRIEGKIIKSYATLIYLILHWLQTFTTLLAELCQFHENL